MHSIKNQISGVPLLPIVQPESIEQAVLIAGAIAKSGLRSIEVVRRTCKAAEAVTAIREAYPDLWVGMGTILNKEHALEALEAGSQFLVTPTISESLLCALNDTGLPYLPGTASPSDILLAKEAGLSEVKFFPATLNGGAAMLQQLNAIFPDIAICPTGGISELNLHEFASLSNVFAVGGSWMIPKASVACEDWQAITDACEQAQAQFTRPAA